MRLEQYVKAVQNQVEVRKDNALKREVQTDASLFAVKMTIEQIKKKRAGLDVKDSADIDEQLKALWRYVGDVDIMIDGMEQACLDTITVREREW